MPNWTRDDGTSDFNPGAALDVKALIAQIGNRALFMLGAKDLIRDRTSLRFRVGRNAKGVNVIHIQLDPSDTYTIRALFVRGATQTLKGEQADVYADNLHSTLEALTGMRTSL